MNSPNILRSCIHNKKELTKNLYKVNYVHMLCCLLAKESPVYWSDQFKQIINRPTGGHVSVWRNNVTEYSKRASRSVFTDMNFCGFFILKAIYHSQFQTINFKKLISFGKNHIVWFSSRESLHVLFSHVIALFWYMMKLIFEQLLKVSTMNVLQNNQMKTKLIYWNHYLVKSLSRSKW